MFEARSLRSQSPAAAPALREVDRRPRSGAAPEESLERAERFGHRLEALVDSAGAPIQRTAASERSSAPGRNRLPLSLRARLERLSGVSLGDVRVHHNSPKPAEIEAHAYTRGAEIHLSPGQEHHLPHEAWHVVQQKRGRIAATGRIGGLAINADPSLEREADAPSRPGTAALSHGAGPAESAAVVQAKWIRVEGSDDPGDYYWDGRHAPTGQPPGGGRHVPAPPLQRLEDTHKGGGGGNMKALRTVPDRPFQDLDMLSHLASQASQEKGIFYRGPSEPRGLGRQPVSTSIPTRDKSLHTKLFRRMTGGQSSSTQYQQSLGTREPNTNYQILHGMGHGEGGTKTQDPRNLASASEGTNTYMIPYDKSISGNPDVHVDTSFTMRKGTQRAEVVHQRFFHKDLPSEPIHSIDWDGDLPKPTVSQYEEHERRASRFTDRRHLSGAAHLLHFSQSHRHHPYALPPGRQNAWGRLGRFAPGSHPLDPQPKKDGDGIL